jgi:type I protein arginine methyltransferase
MSYSFQEYARMLGDPVRSPAYLAAIRETVRPGSVVADIGAGPGALGVYAATLGARRVFLVEPDASVYAATELAAENGVADRVEIIRAPSTEIELPERADVIVSDLRGVMPFHAHHLTAASDMRRRLLAPGGVCIPRRDTVMTALVEDATLLGNTVGAWSGLHGTLAHESFARKMANGWYRARATEAQLLTAPTTFVTLDYDLPTPALTRRWEATATRDGTAHGLLVWFDAELTKTIAFSNSPCAPPALYGQAFFPFAPAMPLRRDERVVLELRGIASGDDYAWSWSITRDDGQSARHSTLLGIPLHPEVLARRASGFVPRRSADAELLLAVIEATDGHTSLGELASGLHERFGERFPTPESALSYLSGLEDLWERR